MRYFFLPAVAVALLPAVASAGIVAEIGPEVATGTNGTWTRAMKTNAGWYMGVGTAGDFYVAPLISTGDGLGDWEFQRDRWVNATQHGSLIDHSIVPCTDGGGGFYVTSSANLDDFNDSAYSWYVDDVFTPQVAITLEERNPSRAHNDMAGICSPWGTGAAFGGYGDGSVPGVLVEVDRGGGILGEIALGNVFLMGAGLLADAPTDRILLSWMNIDGTLRLEEYSPTWDHLDSHQLNLAEPGQRTWWPSSFIRVGQYYAISYMTGDNLEPGSGDTGNVAVVFLTEDFEVVEQHVLTDLRAGRDAAMRPHLARDGDLLFVSYDVLTTHLFKVLRLDLDGLEDVDESFDEPDDAAGDSGTDADAEEPTDDSKGGCTTAPATGVAAMWASLMALASRRRRTG